MPAITHVTGFAHLTDLPCLQLQFGQRTAIISLYGGQVLSYRVDGVEQLWLSPTASWQHNQPIRGGIPICWPWFGVADPQLTTQPVANHGLVRNRLWQQLADEYCPDHSLLVLAITVSDIPWHTEPVQLQCRYQLDRRGLHLHLHVSGGSLERQQAAFHSYFLVDDVRQTSVAPLPAYCHDKVSGEQSASAVHFGQEVDRIYHATDSQLTLHRPAVLPITQGGHDASILWNPGQHKGSAAIDIGPEQWARFVCVETARLSLAQTQPLDLHLQLNQ